MRRFANAKSSPSVTIETNGRLGIAEPMCRVDLETIRHSDGAFTLLLDSGEAIRGMGPPEQIDASELAALFGKQAVVTGIARFRPSGAVLRIEAERLKAARWSMSV